MLIYHNSGDDQSGRDDAPCADSEKLMEVLDQLNVKDGKRALRIAISFVGRSFMNWYTLLGIHPTVYLNVYQ
ncbi:Error-prone repair protein UmuC [Salmonella enterica subsp. arizonae]|uniref:Error-prone repair protein UmuC n=1 Tax=Salmonella enterica subsp. arizonae TaxID=59203 RepID=A0A379T7X0_SALER|nr:Error-prone repair protein UmuC [Salmonella enterica subsp. arizonae]